MQKPRNSILQLFDPLLASSPHTPRREVANASPDSSDKENDLPNTSADPLSLTQFFKRTYKVDRLPKPATPRTPSGKLIDLDDISINEEDQLVFIRLDNQDLLRLDDESSPEGEEDSENAAPATQSNVQEAGSRVHDNPQMFTTPQNRKILADIDIDVPHPPKPPVKQGTLKISFLRHAMDAKPESGTPSSVIIPPDATSTPREDEPALKVNVPTTSPTLPMIALHPPISEPKSPPESIDAQVPTNKCTTHLSPEASSYFGDSLSVAIPRGTLPSTKFDAHRASIDLQSSFQFQLQNSDFSFDLVNDRVSFFGGQESFIYGIDDFSDLDTNTEERNMDELIKIASLDEAALAAETIFKKSPPASVPSSPVSDPESIVTLEEASPPHHAADDVVNATDAASADGETDLTKMFPALRIAKKNQRRQDSTSSGTAAAYRPSTTSSSGGASSAALAANPKPSANLKLPMRVPLPTSSAENALPARNSFKPSTRLTAPSAAVFGSKQGPSVKAAAALKTQADFSEGPKRVLIQPRSIGEQCLAKGRKLSIGGNMSKAAGPQRVLVRPVPSAAPISVKKIISDSTATSSSSVSVSRIPGPSIIPSRIAGLARRPGTKIGKPSQLGGAVKKV